MCAPQWPNTPPLLLPPLSTHSLCVLSSLRDSWRTERYSANLGNVPEIGRYCPTRGIDAGRQNAGGNEDQEEGESIHRRVDQLKQVREEHESEKEDSTVQFNSNSNHIIHPAWDNYITWRRAREENKTRMDDKLRQGYKHAVIFFWITHMVIQYIIIHYYLI